MHWTCPGAHTPWHWQGPVEQEQVWLVQLACVPSVGGHSPLAPHVSTAVAIEQRVVVGTQVAHFCVWPLHSPAPHVCATVHVVPSALHWSEASPKQRKAFAGQPHLLGW